MHYTAVHILHIQRVQKERELYEGVNHLCAISRCVRNANLQFFLHVLVPKGYASRQVDISALQRFEIKEKAAIP